ncbi:MAG TPA: hypothetical protein VIL46_01570 [Gemmataceae bacterium]
MPDPTPRPFPLRFGWVPFVALVLLLQAAHVGVRAARSPRADAFLIGDCPYYAAAARSLWEDGDFDLLDELAPGAPDPAAALDRLRPHSSFFALGPDGRVVPKHSVLLPVLSCPMFALFGTAGLLAINVLQLTLLTAGIALLGGGGPGSRLLALAGLATTPLLAYSFNYSPDVLAAALLVWSAVLARRGRPGWGGLLAGLAVWAKVYLALLVLPVAAAVAAGGLRPLLRFGTAALAALLPMLLIHANLYGAPWASGYDREAHVAAGGFVLAEHYSRFNQPLGAGLANLLFDPSLGLAPTAPLWLLWPAGLAFLLARGGPARRAERVWALACAAVIAGNLLLFAPYDQWDASVSGNRFLFPALALGLAVQGPLWDALLARARGGSGSAAGASNGG